MSSLKTEGEENEEARKGGKIPSSASHFLIQKETKNAPVSIDSFFASPPSMVSFRVLCTLVLWMDPRAPTNTTVVSSSANRGTKQNLFKAKYKALQSYVFEAHRRNGRYFSIQGRCSTERRELWKPQSE